MTKGSIVFDVLANLIPVSYGHKHVRQYQVWANIGNLPDRGFTVADGDDVDALIFQGKPDHLLYVAVVVRDQNLSHCTSSRHPFLLGDSDTKCIGALSVEAVNQDKRECVGSGYALCQRINLYQRTR
jgi:hypothetical protein